MLLKNAPPPAGAPPDPDEFSPAAVPEPPPKALDDPKTGAVPDPNAPVDEVLAFNPDEIPPKLDVPEEPNVEVDLPKVVLPNPPPLDEDAENGFVAAAPGGVGAGAGVVSDGGASLDSAPFVSVCDISSISPSSSSSPCSFGSGDSRVVAVAAEVGTNNLAEGLRDVDECSDCAACGPFSLKSSTFSCSGVAIADFAASSAFFFS
mmetsp:Transcript_36354/g.87786  ORF Transcript_36354/g.87786 Transcript_36354/m.87786 type:complete len:205 (+) Transcript_36354:1257-1871(+)